MKKYLVVFVLLPVFTFGATPTESAKALLKDAGFIDSMLNMPWQAWQGLTPDQKKVFEEKCQYNGDLLEAELADFLVGRFSGDELEQLRVFYGSDLGKKWTAVSRRRGGFDTPELFKAASRWSDGRQDEARAYVESVETGREWKPTGYRAQVGDFTAKLGTGYSGKASLRSILGGSEADFASKLGPPSMREQRTAEVVGLDAFWSAYRVGATVLRGKITQISFTRLPDEGVGYPEKLRTKIPQIEIDSFLSDFAQGAKWTVFEKVPNEPDASVGRVEGTDVHCLLRPSTIIFHTSQWGAKSFGP